MSAAGAPTHYIITGRSSRLLWLGHIPDTLPNLPHQGGRSLWCAIPPSPSDNSNGWLVLIVPDTHGGFGKEPCAFFSPAEHVKEEQERPQEPVGLAKFPVNPSPASSVEGLPAQAQAGQVGEVCAAVRRSESCLWESPEVCVCVLVCVRAPV